MAKEEKDHACALELSPGLNGVDYKQKFVQAPMSAHPKCYHRSEDKFEDSGAMKITMGK